MYQTIEYINKTGRIDMDKNECLILRTETNDIDRRIAGTLKMLTN